MAIPVSNGHSVGPNEMTDLQIPILESPRLRLEPLSQMHSDGMFALWSEASVCAHAGPAVDAAGVAIELPARSRSESDRLLEFWLDRARSGTGLRWAVILREGGEFTGAVGFNSLGTCSEYAYHFVPRFWGLGIAAEASRIALDWGFSRGADSITCFIEHENAASTRLARRLGFEPQDTASTETPRFLLSR
jgi:RimJ/RimL family protein N-acetyltransferase